MNGQEAHEPWQACVEGLKVVEEAMRFSPPLDPLTAEEPPENPEPRTELQQRIWKAHEAVIRARLNLRGDSAPRALAAWSTYEDALRGFTRLIEQV